MRVRPTFLVAAATFIVALGAAPQSAFAQSKASVCKDGTTSSATGKGACSGHGGVDAAKTADATKASKTAAKSAKSANATTGSVQKVSPVAKTEMAAPPTASKKIADTKAKNDAKDATGATAQCKDGTYSHAASHRGACSGHGGVAKFLK